MKPQEVLSIFTQFNSDDTGSKATVTKTYPELDPYFERGMYIEKITQTCFENGKCVVTFVFRYYNPAQSQGK